MMQKLRPFLAATAVFSASAASAQTATWFTPLTQSAPVTAPDSVEERNAPWVTPAGIVQSHLTSMSEIEGDAAQSILRVPGLGDGQSMWDMVSYDPTGEFIFIPHETEIGAGASRYSVADDTSTLLFRGDQGGASGDWSNDFAAFDPSLVTPNGTLFVAEEWAGEGRVIEVLNPFAPQAEIEKRELQSFANVAHEGLRFSRNERTIYFVDEWNSGALYKLELKKKGDYTRGQTFVLVVDDFDGDPSANFNQGVNVGKTRVGAATWVPITDKDGNPLTVSDPFRNGPTLDPRTNPETRGGRAAADEVNGTPYGRPEDIEVSTLANGAEVLYFAATSESAIYSVEMMGKKHAMVRLMASQAVTPKNAGFAPTTAALNSPDNLAQDALGNIYIVEDAPNGSSTGGDIWFMRDVNDDGVAESLDHFMSVRVAGCEATGMIFNPAVPTEYVVVVMHPTSTDLDVVPGGAGDALWKFDLSGTAFADLLD